MSKTNRLAIRGGQKVREQSFSHWPPYKETDYNRVGELLKERPLWRGTKTPAFWSGKESTTLTEGFEETFSRYLATPYLFTLNSGTTALNIALKALELEQDDEVIVTPYTYIASASSIKIAGARPLFADICPKTLNMSAESAASLITEKTRAILPVHFGGIPLEMEPFYKLATRHNLHIIEDCAHVISARWRGKNVGTLGTIGCFSFQGTKLLTAGEGGAITTGDLQLAEKMFSLHNGGRECSSRKHNHIFLGDNNRLSEIQAALLQIGWESFFQQEAKRAENARYLLEQLKGLKGLTAIESSSPEIERNYYLVAFRYNREEFKGLSRMRFISAMNAEGIPCSTGYPSALYENPLFCPTERERVEYKERNMETERACKEIIWFEHHLFLGTREDIDDIVEAIYKVKESADELLRK